MPITPPIAACLCRAYTTQVRENLLRGRRCLSSEEKTHGGWGQAPSPNHKRRHLYSTSRTGSLVVGRVLSVSCGSLLLIVALRPLYEEGHLLAEVNRKHGLDFGSRKISRSNI